MPKKGKPKFRRRTKEVRRDWILRIKEWVERENLPVSVRQAYYILIQMKNPDGTPKLYPDDTEYDALSKEITEHRKLGTLDWDYILDESREKWGFGGQDNLEDYLSSRKDDYHRDIWRTQDNYIIVFLEKDALSNLVWDSLPEHQIHIIATRGYMSWGAFYKLIETERKKWYSPEKWNWKVLMLFDYDQDGFDAENLVKEQFEHFKIKPEFKRVAITETQVTQYKLPMLRLPIEDMSKKQREKFGRWLELHPNGEYCELEAMHPRDLKKEIELALQSPTPLLDEGARKLEKTKQEVEKELINIDSSIVDKGEFDSFDREELKKWLGELGYRLKEN